MSYCQHCADLMKSESDLLKALEGTEAELATAKEVLADWRVCLMTIDRLYSGNPMNLAGVMLRPHKYTVARLLGEE